MALLAALEIIIFWSYFSGANIPPWDFLGSYNTDAYLWWSQGSFFDPISWVPTVWSGYPAALNLQNSAWYLPVGMMSMVGPFTLHSAAILNAVHVAIGFLGTFALARSLRSSYGVASFAATMSFFGVGYFTNAEHVDIVRGWALVPWVLLVLSSRWPWNRLWSIPVASFVLWQTATGIYPGMIISMIYVGVVWVIVDQIRNRLTAREYLFPLALSALAACALSLPRLLPYALMQQDAASGLSETSLFSFPMLGTLAFGYSSDELPNDISMRSFFVPATAIVFAFFARRAHESAIAALTIAIPACVMGLPFLPWFDAVQFLPGQGLSRFSMSDFKVFLVLAVVLAAASGLSWILGRPSRGKYLDAKVFRLAAAAAAVALLGVIGWQGPFASNEWKPGFAFLVAALLLAAACVFVPHWGRARDGLILTAALVLSITSGAGWAYANAAPWQVNREAAEEVTYGATVRHLLAQREDVGGHARRPAREALPVGFTETELNSVLYNGNFYSGGSAVGGYLNLKGSTTQADLSDQLLSASDGDEFAEFLAAPGSVYGSPASEEPTAGELAACVKSDKCGTAGFTPVSYEAGRVVYDIQASMPSTLTYNEAYFQGWTARSCTGDDCVLLSVQRSDDSLVEVAVEEGASRVELEYHTPGRTVGWIGFASGGALAVGAPILNLLSRYRAKKALS